MTFTQKTKKYLEVIQNAKEEGNLAIFIGAGLSVCEDKKKYKNWDGITKKIVSFLNCNKNLDNLRIAELYKLQFGKDELKKIVLSNFPKTPDKAGDLHKSLVKVNPHYLITTNWDKLIDDAINNTTLIFDKIVDDVELVQSKNNSKYIKMHGDFEHNNFVFTESDYINYSKNFPLIENFLKSIFSTHVVVLIGYSFNDMDLKQIAAWVHENSQVRLPIYMVTTDTKIPAELSYLGKYGIKLFRIKSRKKEDFIELFQYFDKEHPKNFINDPCSYIYNKLKGLESYSVILQSQIDDALSNCCIQYHGDNTAKLCLHNWVATYDYDKDIRKIYEMFLENAPTYNQDGNKHREKFRKIMNILKRADIHGLCNDYMCDKPINITFDVEDSQKIYDNYSEAFNFEFKGKKLADNPINAVFALYATEQYDRAFTKTEKQVFESKIKQNYSDIFINFFNYNILLKQLKLSFNSDKKTQEDFEKYRLIDIENEFSKLPEQIQKIVLPIYSIVTFGKIHKLYQNVQADIEKVDDHIRILVENGDSWESCNGHRLIHKNLVDFVVNNGLCIEDFNEYKKTCLKFIEISQKNQLDVSIWTPNKTELYTCIKYLDTKELKVLLHNYSEKNLIISDELHIWLINDVLKNCVKNYIDKKTPFSHLEKYIDNTLLILSLINNSKVQIRQIITQIKKAITNVRNNMSIFENIDLFFLNQYKLFKEESNIIGKPALDIYETALTKLTLDKWSLLEIEALCRNIMINICNIAIKDDTHFSNLELLEKILSNINEMKSEIDKYRIIETVVLIIYQMGSVSCKIKIDNFVNTLDESDNKIKIKDLITKYSKKESN